MAASIGGLALAYAALMTPLIILLTHRFLKISPYNLLWENRFAPRQILTDRDRQRHIGLSRSATSCQTSPVMVRGSFLKPAFRKEREKKGLAAWCVNVPKYLSDTGKRRQLFYDTQAEAKTVCQQYLTRRANFGVSLATMSPKLISEAAECYERLKPYNVKLLDVVNVYIEAHKQRTASVSFLNLCNLYIDSRPDRNRDHLKGLQNSRDRFPVLHDRLVSDITHRDIEPLLAPIPAGGRNLVMRHLRAFFNFGIKKKYLLENPIAAIDFSRRPRKEVEVIAVDQVRAMLDAALADDLPLLPYLVFGFFAGVRPEDELMSLELARP